MSEFKGKVAFITGAGGGMGLAISRQFLNHGGQAILIDVKDEPAELAEFSGNYVYVQGDLTDEATVEKAMGLSESTYGRLDYLVNVAGVLWFDRDKSVLDIDMDVWDQVFNINLRSMALTIRHAVPVMRKSNGGAMVHFSTIQCLRGDSSPQDAYSASKAGVGALSKSAAMQFAADGIRSNVIYPGVAMTPMQARWEGNDEIQEAVGNAIPLGRMGVADDMANACLFLLSDKASYITGTDLIVDGGISAKL
ncbi:SDR family NAD(P)-dependent oxidoreductase [Emcibacter nanhaiensis]|uniref:SDR family oxidoreductase n=1 Tax=Emcibacter nanhaiensis TaxID=1505037 RepID=A0A501PJG6_9PROT|nr:SDR family oxidoreductase [Emcibacter nanhaiensis]TPD60653.1 SDR family oxidoreductase [Emcibacter nanhaiensis]